ncbi:MAG: tetratricopeptide repeat protein, partial [Acidobacteriota bacterium]
AIGGLNPVPYHVTNVLLHVVNVLLLFALTRHLAAFSGRGAAVAEGGRTAMAFTAAGLFAVHPMLTEAVGYVSGRAGVLATTGFLGSMLLFQRAVAGVGARALVNGLGAAMLFLLAIAAKETAVMLPAVLLAGDFLLSHSKDRAFWRRVRWLYLPLLAAACLVAATRVWWYVAVEHPAISDFRWQHILLELHVLDRYVRLLVLPASLSLVPHIAPLDSILDVRVLTGTAVLMLICGLAVHARQRHPLASFGIAWFLLSLVPSAALVILAPFGHAMAEHRVYLASCGFFMSVAAFAWLGVEAAGSVRPVRFRVAAGALVVVLAVLTSMTVARNRVWSHPVSLWADASRKAPTTWIAHYGLGEAYRAEGDCAAAAGPYQRAIEIRPDNPAAYVGWAACLMAEGRHDDAQEQLRLAVYRAPGDLTARLALAAVESQVFGNHDEALALCRAVLRMSPGNPSAGECVRDVETARPVVP